MNSSSKAVAPLLSAAAPPAASTVVLLATLGVAQARDLCADIDYLIEQSRTQFAEVMGKPNNDAGDHDVTLTLPGASYCHVTKNSNGSFYHCGWEFPYRAKQAYESFDAFVRDVNLCIGQHATMHSDQSVNHPDYYALRRYETDQADVSVSVKDKGALGRTFVFIRVQGGKGS